MTRLLLDADLRARLKNLDERLEVCDEQGNPLGQFIPQAIIERMAYDWAKSQITDEELELARRQPGGRTTAEVLERLGGIRTAAGMLAAYPEMDEYLEGIQRERKMALP